MECVRVLAQDPCKLEGQNESKRPTPPPYRNYPMFWSVCGDRTRKVQTYVHFVFLYLSHVCENLCGFRHHRVHPTVPVRKRDRT